MGDDSNRITTGDLTAGRDNFLAGRDINQFNDGQRPPAGGCISQAIQAIGFLMCVGGIGVAGFAILQSFSKDRGGPDSSLLGTAATLFAVGFVVALVAAMAGGANDARKS